MKILVAALTFVFLSVGSTLAAGDTAPGKLRVGVDPSYAPFSGIDETGRYKGFDIDIAQALCARLEVVCVFVPQQWGDLIPGLLAGKHDAIISSMSITEKRRQLVSFTDRYYSNVTRFVARKDSGFDPAAPAGKRIGVMGATIASDWLGSNWSDVASVKEYTGSDKLIEAFVGGQLDAIFGDSLGNHFWLKSPEGSGFEFVGKEHRLDEGIGIAVRKEDETLRKRLNGAIRAILADGTYRRINERYFPFSIY